ncbi:DUF1643 domain-containing protein [Metaclostridioides mangenotii]|uniref:DUF1643 domain-containing protein n=1 Tax=Metaclostridioides mangenotii TaxID=1540 RepID=UPI0028EF8F9B|nr:DUF1643 domain-containing protein [Clostridioides mangenotii]
MSKEIYDKGIIKSSAIFDEDNEGNRFRYVLERIWDKNEDKPMVSVIMFNPSYADGLRYDYTSMKIINYLIDKGECRGVYILNLYPIIKSTRDDVKGDIKKLSIKENNKSIIDSINMSSKVYFAWGSNTNNKRRIEDVINNLMVNGFKFANLLVNDKGESIHPSRCTIFGEEEKELKKYILEL